LFLQRLASRPSGKLARRRQNICDAPSGPTPAKALSVPRPNVQLPSWHSCPDESLSRCLALDPSSLTRWLGMSSPSVMTLQMPRMMTCLRLLPRSFKGPFGRPCTAPPTNPRSGFLFNPKPMPTHTPERKREHVCFPSEGVFNLSSDEDSSFFSPSDASSELKAKADFPLLVAALLRQLPLGICRPPQNLLLLGPPSRRVCLALRSIADTLSLF
jgi:hypothetical protein